MSTNTTTLSVLSPRDRDTLVDAIIVDFGESSRIDALTDAEISTELSTVMFTPGCGFDNQFNLLMSIVDRLSRTGAGPVVP
jgi:hypothetical protein